MEKRFRTTPATGISGGNNNKDHVILGVAVAQAVEALGHGIELDDVFLEQLAVAGNRKGNGVKARYTHPGLSSDGMGKYLGRLKRFRFEEDERTPTLRADLHLSDRAFDSPDGDLGGYVLEMAESDPDMFGMSIVFRPREFVWVLDDGAEVKAQGDRPENATTELPVPRLERFIAADVVDEPAANRNGMFSSSLWGTNVLAEEMFTHMDDAIRQAGVTTERAYQFAEQYFHARGFEPKEKKPMAEEKKAPAELEKRLQALEQQLAAAEEKRAEAQAKQDELTKALDRSNQRVAEMEAEAQRERFSQMAAGWHGDTDGHVNLLTALSGEPEQFTFYVETMTAMTAQIDEGALFSEAGDSRSEVSDNATTEFERRANKLASENGTSMAEAMAQVAREDPDLYAQHREKTQGKV